MAKQPTNICLFAELAALPTDSPKTAKDNAAKRKARLKEYEDENEWADFNAVAAMAQLMNININFISLPLEANGHIMDDNILVKPGPTSVSVLRTPKRLDTDKGHIVADHFVTVLWKSE